MNRFIVVAALLASAARAQTALWAAPAAIEAPLVGDQTQTLASPGSADSRRTQAPWSRNDVPISGHDRIYAAEHSRTRCP